MAVDNVSGRRMWFQIVRDLNNISTTVLLLDRYNAITDQVSYQIIGSDIISAPWIQHVIRLSVLITYCQIVGSDVMPDIGSDIVSN